MERCNNIQFRSSSSIYLQTLKIVCCDNVKKVDLCSANNITLQGLNDLTELDWYKEDRFSSLEIKFCTNLHNLNIPPTLTSLTINMCKLQTIKGLETSNLIEMNIGSCPTLKDIVDLPRTLKRLYAYCCPLIVTNFSELRLDEYDWD
ncbi:hypothetical protein QTN25_007849 [Entamoeba marina]